MKRAFARTATLTAALLACGGEALPDRKALAQTADRPEVTQADHPYVGLWVTEDGRVRHELLPNNRYVEARGNREKAYQGRYRVTGDHIDYWDDTGFTADGDFIDGVLHHGGMILHRRR
ncbi:putative ligand-binding protein with streptavidin-like fold [Azospirillum brasilense]|uniref:Putative ligand-binding protein with streptavidin-like fold n=1 Tax=Azospirillum brasilense TaxID=192 RepID=A0A560AP19_AZOBR|nr:Atu4866 domain-containing protein [Azospirillum brasilense]TWA62114.1 putative ligand-binding protein with streptavidin-like fold [Azospirillum brasilense]